MSSIQSKQENLINSNKYKIAIIIFILVISTIMLSIELLCFYAQKSPLAIDVEKTALIKDPIAALHLNDPIMIPIDYDHNKKNLIFREDPYKKNFIFEENPFPYDLNTTSSKPLSELKNSDELRKAMIAHIKGISPMGNPSKNSADSSENVIAWGVNPDALSLDDYNSTSRKDRLIESFVMLDRYLYELTGKIDRENLVAERIKNLEEKIFEITCTHCSDDAEITQMESLISKYIDSRKAWTEGMVNKNVRDKYVSERIKTLEIKEINAIKTYNIFHIVIYGTLIIMFFMTFYVLWLLYINKRALKIIKSS